MVPVNMAQHHHVHIFWVKSTSSQALSCIRIDTGRLALRDMMLLCFPVAREIAFETEIEDEIG